MRLKECYSLVLLTLMFSFYSCGEVEVPEKYLTVNGEKVELQKATLDDYGTNNDITYRRYKLSFKTSDFNPEVYLTLDLFSPMTTRIAETTYTYSDRYESKAFSNVKLGVNLKYDESGVAISGERMDYWDSEASGTINVTMKDDNFMFTFNIELEKDGKVYTVQGVYNDVLSEV